MLCGRPGGQHGSFLEVKKIRCNPWTAKLVRVAFVLVPVDALIVRQMDHLHGLHVSKDQHGSFTNHHDIAVTYHGVHAVFEHSCPCIVASWLL